mmetsp:Transcript_3883/g.14054  ORF Transcript_3883/g.14054 Transcript_3883/m.14054 type:complete len:220 (-) Transcript_3883:1638-2297(-)
MPSTECVINLCTRVMYRSLSYDGLHHSLSASRLGPGAYIPQSDAYSTRPDTFGDLPLISSKSSLNFHACTGGPAIGCFGISSSSIICGGESSSGCHPSGATSTNTRPALFKPPSAKYRRPCSSTATGLPRLITARSIACDLHFMSWLRRYSVSVGGFSTDSLSSSSSAASVSMTSTPSLSFFLSSAVSPSSSFTLTSSSSFFVLTSDVGTASATSGGVM